MWGLVKHAAWSLALAILVLEIVVFQSSSKPPQYSISMQKTFSQEALQSLPLDEQELVREHLANTPDVNDAIHEAYRAAIKQKQQCESKRWRISFQGRELVLRDEADKIVRWIERFKSVGDVVANADPLHVGLPWAAIRILLEITVADARQMAALLTGLNLTRYMINRLEAYLNYFTHLPASATTATFEKALVKMYALVLRFFKDAAIYKKSSPGRIWKTIWQESELDKFNVKCKDWAVQVEIDASNCERELSQQERDSTRKWMNTTLALTLDGISMGVQHVLTNQQKAKYKSIIDWLSPPDPYYNHNAACRKREPGTGDWLLQSDEYKYWKVSDCGLLWLTGKAGCGKTFLCSAVIEDIRQESQRLGNCFAFHYFSFSDKQKQSHTSFLLSIITQLLPIGSVFAGVDQLYDSTYPSKPSIDVLEGIFLTHLRQQLQQSHTVIVLDALDELAEDDEVDGRPIVLEWLSRITENRSYQLRIFITSRPLKDIEIALTNPPLNACRLVLQPELANNDIQKYVTTELGKHPKLRSLNAVSKRKIQEVFMLKSDGMFRWAACQLDTLKALKSTKPKYVEEALRCLPRGLDATYERMLLQIDEMYHDEALAALRWLAFEMRPLTLAELTEACLIDYKEEPFVNDDDRGGHIGDILDILAGLVIVEKSDDDNATSPGDGQEASEDDGDAFAHDIPANEFEELSMQTFDPCVRVRLAHFSVKEYLVSDRIAAGKAARFALREEDAYILGQSCAAYLLYYGQVPSRSTTRSDFRIFPFLEYSRDYWPQLVSKCEVIKSGLEAHLIQSDEFTKNFHEFYEPFLYNTYLPKTGLDSSLYCASHLGLTHICQVLLDGGVDANIEGGQFGNPLQAAAYFNNYDTAKLLLQNGANVNTLGGKQHTALGAASMKGNVELVKLLLEEGADPNTSFGDEHFSTALQVASFSRNRAVLRLLLDGGADVNQQGGCYGNALQTWARYGAHEVESIKLLLDAGAKVNAQGGRYGSALQAASGQNDLEVTQLLLDAGADVNAQGGRFGTALGAASARGFPELVQFLLDHGADINAHPTFHGTALQAASANGQLEMVQLLLDRGADINIGEESCGRPLIAAIGSMSKPDMRIVETLLDAGADVHALGADKKNALQVASERGHLEAVQLLLDRGADVNIGGGSRRTPLHAAIDSFDDIDYRVVETLLDAGADVEALGDDGMNALELALDSGSPFIFEVLTSRGAKY